MVYLLAQKVFTMKTINYKIAEHYLPALINGDYTGMSAEEEYALEMFLQAQGLPKGHWSPRYHYDDRDFAKCEVSGLMVDCFRMDYVVTEES